MFSAGVQFIKLIWPFVKEMIIGKNSFGYAMRKNRVKVVFFFLVLLSFFVNILLVPRLITISASHVKLEEKLRKQTELIGELNQLVDGYVIAAGQKCPATPVIPRQPPILTESKAQGHKETPKDNKPTASIPPTVFTRFKDMDSMEKGNKHDAH